MTEISKEMLYRELLVLKQQIENIDDLTQQTVSFLKAMNGELAAGRTKINEIKARYRF